MERALNYKDILLKHKKCIVHSRSECDISTEIAGKKIQSPVFCSNMKSILTKDICKIFDEAGWFHIYHRIDGNEDILKYVERANKERWNFCSISIGIKNKDYELLKIINNKGYKLSSICIDVALSWQDNVEKMIKYIKKYFPHVYLIVGNGDNPEWIKWLEDLGVNAAKINIGVSSSCRTYQFVGFKSSTVSDLIKCKKYAKNIKIISDGGLTVNTNNEVWIGDCAKAIKFGADYICSGALFKNCLDSPSIRHGYFGNASRTAKGDSHVEGAHLIVETNGLTIRETIKLVEESLKSSCSYSGGFNLNAIRDVDYQIIS